MGQNGREIPNLEFENQGFLENQDFLPTEQAGTNICWYIKTQIFRYVSACSLEGKHTTQTAHCAAYVHIWVVGEELKKRNVPLRGYPACPLSAQKS